MTTEITLTPAEREKLRDQLTDYCEKQFDLELEQFDAESAAAEERRQPQGGRGRGGRGPRGGGRIDGRVVQHFGINHRV